MFPFPCLEWRWLILGLIETRGRSLEELDELFESDNPKKASLQYREVVVRSDGTVKDTT
jgi:hypothetical protein